MLALFRLWLVTLLSFGLASAETHVLRVGHFPLLTHGSALVIRAIENGRLDVHEVGIEAAPKIRFSTYDSGAGAMEALLAGSIDVTFTGPTPLFAAHARFPGAGLAIISGATTGGSALLLRSGVPFSSPTDLRGLRIATPQIGNTQDISCRAWLRQHGFTVTQQGGDVQVIPSAPSNQMLLLRSSALDGAWAVEPWVSRFENELKMRVIHEDTTSLATVVVTQSKTQTKLRSEIDAFLGLHRAVIGWMEHNPERAATIAAHEIEAIVHRGMPTALVLSAWHRLSFSDRLDAALVRSAARDLQESRLITRSLSLETLGMPNEKHSAN